MKSASKKISSIDDKPVAVNAEELDATVSALINQVAERVYAARKAKRLSRRALSERSGVSPRYLVRLEGGEGNISIGLLQRIAVALDRPIEWLVGADDTLSDELARLVIRYRNADTATRTSVLSMLDPEQLRERKAERVCLIGLRGAGKSTLGARLSKEMDLPFIELNQQIEHSAGMPVGDVIAMYGEEGYRKLEADTLKEIIATRERLILAVAGGVVEEAKTFAEVLGRFHTVWLKAEPTDHMERVRAQGDLRPMAGNPKAMEQLREILVARESRYGQAEHHVDTSDKTIDATLAELRSLVLTHGILTPKHV